jgi:Leucine-rich repeat (LRR) protein
MSELALKLIREAKEQRLNHLDLGNCDLTVLPDELFELTWLEELILNDNKELYDLKDISKLKQINLLDISNTKVHDLSPLKYLIRNGLPVDSYATERIFY